MPRKRPGGDINDVPAKVPKRQIPAHIESILNHQSVEIFFHELLAYSRIDRIIIDHKGMMQNVQALHMTLIQSMRLIYKYLQIIALDFLNLYLLLNPDERELFFDGFYQRCDYHFRQTLSPHLILNKEKRQLEDIMLESEKLLQKRNEEQQSQVMQQQQQEQQQQQIMPQPVQQPFAPVPSSSQQIPGNALALPNSNTRHIQMQQPPISFGNTSQKQLHSAVSGPRAPNNNQICPPPPYSVATSSNNPKILQTLLNSNSLNIRFSTQQTVNMSVNPDQPNSLPHNVKPQEQQQREQHQHQQQQHQQQPRQQQLRQQQQFYNQPGVERQAPQQQLRPQQQQSPSLHHRSFQQFHAASAMVQQQRPLPYTSNVYDKNQLSAVPNCNATVNNIITNSLSQNLSAPNLMCYTRTTQSSGQDAVIATTVSNEQTCSSSDEPEFISEAFCATEDKLDDHLQPYLEIFKESDKANEIVLPINDIPIVSADDVPNTANANNITQQRKSMDTVHESNGHALQVKEQNPSSTVNAAKKILVVLNPNVSNALQMLTKNSNQQNIVSSPGPNNVKMLPSTASIAGENHFHLAPNILNNVSQRILTTNTQLKNAPQSANTHNSSETQIKNHSTSLNSNKSMTQSEYKAKNPNDPNSFKKIAARRKSIAVPSVPQPDLSVLDTADRNESHTANKKENSASFNKIAKRRQSIADFSMPSMPSLSPPPQLLSPIKQASSIFKMSYSEPSSENSANQTQPVVNVILDYHNYANKEYPKDSPIVKLPKADLADKYQEGLKKPEINQKQNDKPKTYSNKNRLQLEQSPNGDTNEDAVKSPITISNTTQHPIEDLGKVKKGDIDPKANEAKIIKGRPANAVETKPGTPKVTNGKSVNTTAININKSTSEASKTTQRVITVKYITNIQNSDSRESPRKDRDLSALRTARASSTSKVHEDHKESKINAIKIVPKSTLSYKNISIDKIVPASSLKRNDSAEKAATAKSEDRRTIDESKISRAKETLAAAAKENTNNSSPDVQEDARLRQPDQTIAQDPKNSSLVQTSQNKNAAIQSFNSGTQKVSGSPVKAGPLSNTLPSASILSANQNKATAVNSPSNNGIMKNTSTPSKTLPSASSKLSSDPPPNQNKVTTKKSLVVDDIQRDLGALIKVPPSSNASTSSTSTSFTTSSSSGTTSSGTKSDGNTSSRTTSLGSASLRTTSSGTTPSEIKPAAVYQPPIVDTAQDDTIILSDDDDDCQIIEIFTEIIDVDCETPNQISNIKKDASPDKHTVNCGDTKEPKPDKSNSNSSSLSPTKANGKSAMEYEFYCVECSCRAFRICKSCYCVSYCSLKCEQASDAHAECETPNIVNLIDYDFAKD